jgi:acyl transferase domain-containing protein
MDALIGAQKTNARYGYFLEQPIDAFDAGFFNISRKEAEAMDPQQRLILEVVYEALEDGESFNPNVITTCS